jgi:bla regulator protein BlaR1
MIAAGLLIKVTVVTVLALAGTWAMRRNRAAARHVLLAAGFAGLLVLPVISLVGPTLTVPMTVAAIAPSQPTFVGSIVGDQDAARAAQAVSIATPTDRSPFSWRSLTTILIDAWIVGSAVLLLQIAAGLAQVRALRRTALPWREGRVLTASLATDAGIRRQIDLLLHESLSSPMTCGILHPAIVLPADAPGWSEADLRRAIVHELEHVSRVDWLTQGIARVVLACYWFHPMVWLAWRQLAVEAERACDDAVLRRSEATAYADQLVDLARRRSASARQPQLAMASRHDLATRVSAVLDGDQPRGRAGARRVTLAFAGAAIVVVAMSPWRLVAAQPQPQTATPSVATQRFEAATVKPCKAEEDPRAGRGRGTAGGTNATASAGRMFVPCVSLERLIYLAYASYGAREDERLANDDLGSASSPTKVRGGPAWVHSDNDGYSIEATAPGASERTVLLGTMLPALLEERFRLKLHRESEDVPMFALTVAKSGFKLKPMQEGDCDADRTMPSEPGQKRPCGMMTSGANGPNAIWMLTGFKVSSLASRLTGSLGRHVIDRTGLTDQYIIRLEFHPDDATPGINWGERDLDQSAPRAASIFTALDQQLGLKVDSIRGPRGYLVIDHVERPRPD